MSSGITGNPPIRLIVLDIDGTLTDGETRAWDLPMLGTLAELNRQARAKPSSPAVTLCTGRQPPYVEAVMQAIDGHLPAVFENGAGLYVPEHYQFRPHPLVGDGKTFGRAVRRLAQTLDGNDRVFLQPGKMFSHSIYATDPADTGKLYVWSQEALAELSESVDLVYAASCLNLLPKGVNKGVGVEFLAEVTGIPPAAMLGVGDSDNDLEFLKIVGHSAAPANANERVKAQVDYVSSLRTSRGLWDILRRFALV